MSRPLKLAIVSDIHYASAAEQTRGHNFEFRGIVNPLVRRLLKMYRHYIWLRHPLQSNHLLDEFLSRAGEPDYVVANGDYTCDSAALGVSDPAAFQSVDECLGKLRARFGTRFHAIYGDHELGKVSLAGDRGGMRLASFYQAREKLGLAPFWMKDVGAYALMGVTSSLVGLPVFEPDTLPEERAEWHRLREAHLGEIRAGFSSLKPGQRVILFCHDPTALPFLARDPGVKVPRIAQTIIGHLHSNLFLWQSRILAGMPPIRFMGHSIKRMSSALHEARYWKPFHVRLCPALSGIELLKDGGFLTAELDEDPTQPPRFQFHPIRR